MAIEPGGEIGEEVHDDRDQFFRVEKGKGEVVIDGQRSKIKSDDAIIVPAGARHNIVNTDEKPLRLYTLYAPPEHRDGTVHVTRADAEARKSILTARQPSDPPAQATTPLAALAISLE